MSLFRIFCVSMVQYQYVSIYQAVNMSFVVNLVALEVYCLLVLHSGYVYPSVIGDICATTSRKEYANLSMQNSEFVILLDLVQLVFSKAFC